MKPPPQPYLLDTSVLLALVRGNHLGSYIERTFELGRQPTRPLVSIISHAELAVLAAQYDWGPPRRQILDNLLGNLVTVDVGHPRIIEAYVEIDLYSRGLPAGAIRMKKNDLWIAATARAAGARLLTCDRDFNHLFGSHVEGCRVLPTAGKG